MSSNINVSLPVLVGILEQETDHYLDIVAFKDRKDEAKWLRQEVRKGK